jgi:hypothetical protein
MSSTDQIVTLFESLSFAEKLSLNERLSTILRKEGGGAAAAKKRGPKAKTEGEKPKRKAALGTLASGNYSFGFVDGALADRFAAHSPRELVGQA